MKMKKNSMVALIQAGFACMLIMPLLSCGFFGVPNYDLTVTIDDGIQGTPADGQYTYKDLTLIEYQYIPDNTLNTVEVIYEGSRLEATGSIRMYTHAAMAVHLVDIRDTWTISMYSSVGAFLISFDVTFSGTDLIGGTFSDSRDLSGTWDGATNSLTITYDNWENFILTGTLFGMSGTWSNGSDVSGTWSASRT
ncbi:MAG: hypothetical protein JXI33_08245 [Candidatus Aminicenantes bacterium]|nr:hypothetical protein [Candidatus Aminicenantes bacterium]